MSVNIILEALKQGGLLSILILSLIQISPIKLNPLSYLARLVGRAINYDLVVKIDNLDGQVALFKRESDERYYTSCRMRILRFGEEMCLGLDHTKEHFEHTLIDINEYEKFCAEHPDFRNNIATLTIERIKEQYSKCLKENNFI